MRNSKQHRELFVTQPICCSYYGVTCGNIPGTPAYASVMEIDLSSVGLSGTLPTEIGFFGGLTKLAMGRNNIFGSIPSTIGTMSSLSYLDFGFNGLIGQIPSSIGALTQLQVILLMGNKISSIPSSIGSLRSLTVLYADQNSISGSLPSTIGSMTSLYILSLYENRITGIIPTGLGSMRSLGILYLDDNSLSGTIPSGISSLTDLTTVTLQKNFLTMGGLSALPPSTFSVPTQQGSLNVSANCISYTSLYRREHNASPTRCKCKSLLLHPDQKVSHAQFYTEFYMTFITFPHFNLFSCLSLTCLQQSPQHSSLLRPPQYSEIHPACQWPQPLTLHRDLLQVPPGQQIRPSSTTKSSPVRPWPEHSQD